MEIRNLGPRELEYGRVEVDTDAGRADFDLPLELAFYQAQNAQPRDLLVWTDESTGLFGFHSSDFRVAWDQTSLVEAWIVQLKPGRGGDGLVGLELGFRNGLELPALALGPWSEEAIAWFQERKESLELIARIFIANRDYGRQDA